MTEWSEMRALWETGKGPWASVSQCRGLVTIVRHETLERARQAEDDMNRRGCGAKCERRHQVVAAERALAA